MKHKAIVIAILIGIAAIVLFFLANPFQTQNVDAAKIFRAAQTYTRQLRTAGQPVPETVNLNVLIERNLLNRSDVGGFAGADVTVALTADPNNSNYVLLRARFPDGQEVLAMADGSVQTHQTKP